MPSKHDFNSIEVKQQTRLETLRVVQQRCPLIWDRKAGCLGLDWAELTSEADPMFRTLREHDVFHPGRGGYIGVNGPDPTSRIPDDGTEARALLARNEALYGTEYARWVYGSLENILAEDVVTRNVGVLVADGFYSLSAHDVVATQLTFIRFAKMQARRLGQCLLVTNLVVRGSIGQPAEAALGRWKAALATSVGKESLPDSCLTIYRGKSLQMALARVLYERG